ncbi:hypothetical protein LCGC14_2585340, partial [marine sediment metagenome]
IYNQKWKRKANFKKKLKKMQEDLMKFMIEYLE